jgi:hypothetical protein
VSDGFQPPHNSKLGIIETSMETDIKKILLEYYKQYLELFYDSDISDFESFLSYNFNFITERNIGFIGNDLVHDELNELKNIINSWNNSIQRWKTWNHIIKDLDENTAWDLRREFLEDTVHCCLLKPSSIKDTMISVATNIIHQLRIAKNNSYKDFLDGDISKPNERPRHLTRAQKERRLAEIISVFDGSEIFLTILKEIDNKNYKELTSDYRNLTSHTIGPRLGIGVTKAVKRQVVQSERIVEQLDGSYLMEKIPEKVYVRYGIGGTPPLDLNLTLSINIEQFMIAKKCYEHFVAILTSELQHFPYREIPDA